MNFNAPSSSNIGCISGANPNANLWSLVGAIHLGGDVLDIQIECSPFSIGRKPNASLRLSFGTVSGYHALIHCEGEHIFVEDLNSTNGTFVNGVRVMNERIAIKEDDLIHFAEAPFRVRNRFGDCANAGTIAENISDRALALVQLDRLMEQRLVVPHMQPILRLETLQQTGFEILARSRLIGLESATSLFDAASRLGLEVELSQLMREEGVLAAKALDPSYWIYFNIHPKELYHKSFFESLANLRNLAGDVPLVLEIHEAAVTSPELMCELHSHIQDFDIQLAYDDFGSGQARLAELIKARPQVIKFDMSLIRGIDKADSKHIQVIRNLVAMVRDLDVQTLAEGIESEAESQCCKDLGFELAQGYFFGKPRPICIKGDQ